MNRYIRTILTLFLAVCFAAAPLAGAMAQDSRPGDLAPLNIGTGNIIPNQYIVVLKQTASPDIQAAAVSVAQATGGTVIHQYGTAIKGFAAVLPDAALQALRLNPQVDYIQADEVVSLDPGLDGGVETNADAVQSDDVQADAVQTPATWGLDRIDQRALPLNNTYSYLTTAANVNVYIIDTGIRSTHTQFTGRATKDFDSVGDGQNGNDCAGHGTHVAGTIGGVTYGVAKAVKLHAVRVLNCAGSGSFAGVVAGVDWVTAHHVHPAVANMSLGGGYYAPLNTAVTAAINHGVTFVVAAGNDNQNACNYSPASTPLAITVGSTTSTDARSSFSNWGTCLDIFAPGSNITSAWIGSDTATNTISGTSMASPHTAGVAALYLASNPAALPAAVATALVNISTKNVVTDPAGSFNRLLYSVVGPPPVIPTPISPAGNISDTTPTYTFSKVTGATQYQYQLFKGLTLVYTKTVASTACGTTANCVNTPTNVLAYAAYTWKVRAYIGGTWRAFSPAKAFNLTNVPTPISPTGAISDTTPTYTFTKILGATQYQYQLYKGTALVYTMTVAAAACGATANCVNTPATVLTAGSYTWKVRAYVGGAWKAYSANKAFTLSIISGFNSQFTSDAAGWVPQSGSWSVGGGFYNTPGLYDLNSTSAHVNNYPTLTYTARLYRSGGAASTYANYLYFRGSPLPLTSTNGWNNGYRFTVSNDGYVNFGYYQNGLWTWIIPWTPTSLVTSSWNVVKITMNGNYSQLFVNGTRFAYGTLTTFSTGQVGLGYYRGTTNETFSVDYATLVMSAPASGLSAAGGINWDTLTLSDAARSADPNIHQ